MPKIIFKKVLYHLRKVKNPKILIPVFHKKNIDDARESPSFELIKLFQKKKIQIKYHDKFFKTTTMRNYDFKMSSVKLNAKICTIQCNYNYDWSRLYKLWLIEKNSKIIFDTEVDWKNKKLFMFNKDKNLLLNIKNKLKLKK